MNLSGFKKRMITFLCTIPPVYHILERLHPGIRMYFPTPKKYRYRYARISRTQHTERNSTSAAQAEVLFSVIVSGKVPSHRHLRHTVSSLLQQSCRRFSVVWEAPIEEGRKSRLQARFQKRGIPCCFVTSFLPTQRPAEYSLFLAVGDRLAPTAIAEYRQAAGQGADLIYADEDVLTRHGRRGFPFFKPDFSLELFRNRDYITGSAAVSNRTLLHYENGETVGLLLYRMVAFSPLHPIKIAHIRKALIFKREALLPDEDFLAAKKAILAESLAECRVPASVCQKEPIPDCFTMVPALLETPLVSILIPNQDHVPDLKRCLDSIFEKTTYPNFEILILENNSRRKETQAYYCSLSGNPKIRIVDCEMTSGFNYSAINNRGAKSAKGDYFLLLNNDTEVISPDWIEQMLLFAMMPSIGAVGANLFYPDNSLQHAGVILGVGGIADHAFKGLRDPLGGYAHLNLMQRNISAVTAACLMVKKQDYLAVDGLDEAFAVTFNDIDFCLRLQKRGLTNCQTPYARLYHHESISRGSDESGEKKLRFFSEIQRFMDRYEPLLLAGDPYYHPNLSLLRSYCYRRPDEPNPTLALKRELAAFDLLNEK